MDIWLSSISRHYLTAATTRGAQNRVPSNNSMLGKIFINTDILIHDSITTRNENRDHQVIFSPACLHTFSCTSSTELLKSLKPPDLAHVLLPLMP